MLWLEVTNRCQLACIHCYNESGVHGTDGSMTYGDWIDAIDQAAELGVSMVQTIGGEPTLYAGLPGLIAHARALKIEVEVYSNLVHFTAAMWEVFAQPGVRLATSYYSDDPAQHLMITGRRALARTRRNIATAIAKDIPIRVGLIDLGDDQRSPPGPGGTDRARRHQHGLGPRARPRPGRRRCVRRRRAVRPVRRRRRRDPAGRQRRRLPPRPLAEGRRHPAARPARLVR
ncbi:radical SAM protein [Nonomuraea sp. NPDC049637]|uniref:radical SAM protein n=1 Tax=Nonomuraea sp. NPDC049637 TaxID=3154356 RepID=UPI0034326577